MLEIVKWNPKVNEGIYRESMHVKSYSQIDFVANEMVEWLNEKNGYFPIPYKTAYAVSHCQVAKFPWHFFVVDYQFLTENAEHRPKRDNTKNFYFPSQIIVNAEILETPEKLKVNKPVRKVEKQADGSMKPKIEFVESLEKNLIGVPEACMSFLHRTSKTKERYYRVKVRYQYPKKFLGLFWYLKTKTEIVEGLKSHIFQHECEHAKAENMFYPNKKELTSEERGANGFTGFHN